jgi:hypothetical protein
MPGKKTSNMLVRGIPIDVWERIDKLCRRKGMKRRDFVEQALHFFEGEEDGLDYTQNEQSQLSDIDELVSDIEDLKREITKDKDRPKVEKKIDIPDEKNRVGIDQIKPDRGRKLIMKRHHSRNPIPPTEEMKKEVLTTVYCWGLDRQDD